MNRSGFSMPRRLHAVALAVVMLAAMPRQAHACDPNCDAFAFIIVGTPAALGVILIAPILGGLLDHRPNSPYLRALGITVLGTAIGYGIGAAATFPSGEQMDMTAAYGLAALPVVLGTVATILVYRNWSRGDADGDVAEPRLSPLVNYVPSERRVSVGLTWRF